jgi:Peptidase M50B-like
MCGVDLAAIADRVTDAIGAQPAPPSYLVLTTGVVALTSVLVDRVWRVARNTVTIAHEGGHALAAFAARRRIDGIHLHADTSGLTISRGRPTGPGVVVTMAAGYVTPSLLGLGFAALLAADRITAVLWISAGLLAAMLLQIRNLYGGIAVAATGALVIAVSWFASPEAQAAFAYVFSWFLLLGGVRPVFELQRRRRQRRAPQSDADQLARLTGVPGIVWVLVFALVAVAALLLGARILLP